MIDHIWMDLMLVIFSILIVIFDKLAKRYRTMVYFNIIVNCTSVLYVIFYFTQNIISDQLYTSPLVTILIGALVILVVRTSFFITKNIRMLRGDTKVPTFRIYKEGTPHQKRFLIESVVTLISVPILYSLGASLFNYEWKWIEPIGAMIIIVIISALINYKLWWEQEGMDEV